MNLDQMTRLQLIQRCRDLTVQTETDRLTTLGNLVMLENRTSSRHGWFVMSDLNGFKKAQDGHVDGHAYGDRILREYATFLRGICRENEDRVAIRRGGDEFIVWVPKLAIATRVRDLINQWRSADGCVTASAGLGTDIETADAAMYQQKQKKT